MSYSTPEQIERLPWHTMQWDMLWSAKQKERLPHALLLTGGEGLGQREFAEQFAQSLLCDAPSSEGVPCYNCHACHLFKAHTHPDFVMIEPESEGHAIKIDPIRDIVKLIHETPSQGAYRVVIIHRAHLLNHYAANALLKTLEEPTPNVLMFLITDQYSRLPKTVISRCQRVVFHRSDRLSVILDSKESALRRTLYHALADLTRGAGDPLQLAADWQDNECLSILNIMLSWLRDLLCCMVIQKPVKLINQEYSDILASLAKRLKSHAVLDYYDHVYSQYVKLQNGHNVNKQLVLEELFIRWMRLYGPG
jgi:DNA polymerase III subunit delta'